MCLVMCCLQGVQVCACSNASVQGLFALVLPNGATGALRACCSYLAGWVLLCFVYLHSAQPHHLNVVIFDFAYFSIPPLFLECTAMLDGFSCSFDHPSAASWIPVCCVENPNVQTSLVLLV